MESTKAYSDEPRWNATINFTTTTTGTIQQLVLKGGTNDI